MHRAIAAAMCVSLAGCAHGANDIQAEYVPQSMFSGASCDQLMGDVDAVGRKMVSLGAGQDMRVQADRQMMAAAWFLAWPALFFVRGDRDTDQLARAKGEFRALQQAAVAKGCIPESVTSDPRYAYVPPGLPKADDVGYGYDRRR
jgi:hypothetical protein